MGKADRVGVADIGIDGVGVIVGVGALAEGEGVNDDVIDVDGDPVCDGVCVCVDERDGVCVGVGVRVNAAVLELDSVVAPPRPAINESMKIPSCQGSRISPWVTPTQITGARELGLFFADLFNKETHCTFNVYGPKQGSHFVNA